ncbi:MAG: shikimate kinase [Clostridia bacterium]|nr:shikimate kinase [Clostridia bacterium]
MSVTLIGMPSCGKSTLGVLLAKKLGYRFIDSDLLIQEKENALLHDIIENKGIDGFLKIENDVNCAITDSRAVISTGGSAVYSKEAMEHLSTLGKIVYLKIALPTMLARLGDYVHRGVVLPEGYTLADMYAERSELYERYADLIIDVDMGDINSNLEKICDAVTERQK